MEMLIGEYRSMLDDKGRFSFPAKLRSVLQQNELYVTQGLDNCLMLFTTDEWTTLTNKIIGSASIFNNQKRLIMRHFIGKAAKLVFDKSGRLSIPQELRDYASLSAGNECIIFGMNKYMELWNAQTYENFENSSSNSVQEAMESMQDILL